MKMKRSSSLLQLVKSFFFSAGYDLEYLCEFFSCILIVTSRQFDFSILYVSVIHAVLRETRH
jgi:hypothetical protein